MLSEKTDAAPPHNEEACPRPHSASEKEKTENSAFFSSQGNAQESRSIHEESSPQLFNHEKNLPLPDTAAILLNRVHNEKTIRNPLIDAPDPSIFEFELVCLVCFDYDSECSCPSGQPITTIDPQTLPSTQSPPVQPPTLDIEVGTEPARLASTISQTLWPIINQGMIPIFSQQSLVVLRSRALERSSNPKHILQMIQAPIAPTPSPKDHHHHHDGLRCLLCDTLTRRCALAHDRETMRNATKSTYTIRGTDLAAMHMADGMSTFELLEIHGGSFTMKTSQVEDFLLYCSLLPTFGMAYPQPAPKNPACLDWQMILLSLLAETLSCINLRLSRFESLPIRRMVYRDRKMVRAVLRAENFGVGQGFLVMEAPCTLYDLNKTIDGYEMKHVASINNPRSVQQHTGFMSDASSQQPGPGDWRRQEAVGLVRERGWEGIALDGDTMDRLCLRKGTYLAKRMAVIGLPRRAMRGWPCMGKCLEVDCNSLALFAGFAPPHNDSPDTVVYILGGKDPVRWLVISQWASGHSKPLFSIGDGECLGCSIIEAPKGSIIAAGLPPVNIFASRIRREFSIWQAISKRVTGK